MHLIIPYAAFADVPQDTLQQLQLPHLRQLLAQMQCVQRDETGDDVPHLPHERCQARALGWPDAAPWPWAAWAHPEQPGPQAWITPCHWQIGMDQVVMLEPARLQLSDAESQQMLEAMQPFLQEDGLTVRWHSAQLWHASGALFENMPSVSLDRVSGQNVKPWITNGHMPPSLRRLQSEMQMLLYNHPVNDARMARGECSVNSFWVHGAGSMTQPPAVQAHSVVVVPTLREALMQRNLPAWQAAWQALDQDLLAPWASQAPPSDLRLSLCSETRAHTYQWGERSWLQRLGAAFQKTDTAAALQALTSP